MTKFNITHTQDNQEPDFYDLRNDLEGMNLDLTNTFSNYNAALYDYFKKNHIWYAKSISEIEINLLKQFKEEHLKSIEKAYEKQVEFIEWFSEINGEEINETSLEEQK
tara:strand:- start:328 stop:651 length:324 start_codon:yes stop_codon:yes gene_type:complete